MNCREYQHQISLLLYEELPDNEKPGLEAHLHECETCRQAYGAEQSLHSALAEDTAAWDIPSDLLVESRRMLSDHLDGVERKRAWWRIPALSRSFSVVLTPMRLLESAALIAMGLALGVYFTNQQMPVQVAELPGESSVLSAIPANGSVSNLRIVSSNPATGQVELAGEVLSPLRFQGSMADETVLQLLIGALRDADNPGSRLRAVDVLAQDADGAEVKSALIHALTFDENPGVRLRALAGLKEFAGEPDVRSAFMNTLANDTEAGIRVEAIEALTRTHDASIITTLEQLAEQEDNSYLRMKIIQYVGANR